MNWTNNQNKAFSLKNREILVSAAAGSGKTAVMVERILKMVTEEPYIDIDRLLIVTFTKKAAESMRIKIRRELDKRLKDDPYNEHLQRQMLLINHAHISTIDSFCSFIVRNYFYLTEDVSSNFRIGNESEIKLIQSDVLKEVLENEYKKAEADFLVFADYFATGKNDLPLEKVILSLYSYSQSHENPYEWLTECLNAYECFGIDSGAFGIEIRNLVNNYIDNSLKTAGEILEIINSGNGPYMYRDNLEDDIRILKDIRSAENIKELVSLLNSVKFSTLSRKKDPAVSVEAIELCKSKRNDLKKNVKELAEVMAYDSYDSMSEDINKCAASAKELVRVTILFSEELLKNKKKRNVFDHSDVAHIALDILRMENSPAKMQLKNLFEEIFIDEYQDSNRLQEELLYSIAREVGNAHKVFMVGDVKQSIYSFRMACPDLFINKLNTFSEAEALFNKIFLSNNFRSRKQVVDFVNNIFTKLMEKSISGIDYDEGQKLIYSADFNPVVSDSYETEILHFQKDEEDIDSYEAEAYMIGDRIRELMSSESDFNITDRNTGKKRKLQFSDICILVRSQKDVAYPLKKVLESEFNIPVSMAGKEEFFESLEVSFVLQYLRILDNPYNDFPFTAVLMCPVVGLTAEELAQISMLDKKASIYELAKAACYENPINETLTCKLQVFFDAYFKLRDKVSYLPLYKLVDDLIELSGIEAFVSTMPSGEKRVNNLKKLNRYIVDFQNTEYHSLFDFLRYIDKISEYEINLGGQEDISADSDSVKIMTMHKSKGLEFPVVFLAGLNKSFNLMDERSSVLLHPDLGIGFDCIDIKERTRRKSIFKRLISKKLHTDKYGEEIRILYVAMTRAEEKLILVCCHDEKGNICDSKELGYFDILKGKRYWDWLKVLLSDNESLYSIKEYSFDDFMRIHQENEIRGREKAASVAVITDDLPKGYQWLEKLGFIYESKPDNFYKKISVTFLKEQYNIKDEEGSLPIEESLIEKEVEFPLVPEFLKDNHGLSPAKRGLVYHSVLEHWNYELDGSVDEIKAFCKRLCVDGIFTEEEVDVINPVKIQSFLNNPIGKRMKSAYDNGLLKREASFSVILEHMDKGFDFLDQDVLLQGIIDAYFEEDDGLVIVDYKTDYLSDGDIGHLVDKYAMQLKCYKYALEKITSKKVKEIWIYSVYCDDTVRINE